jgi:hypothetical protein
MAKRITFPKVSGTNTWRNAETGIVIERNFANGLYEIFYTGTNDAVGYWGSERSLKEARELATERVETVREQVAEAYADALLIEGEMIAHGLDVTETAANAPNVPAPIRYLWSAAAHSLEAGFLDAAAERLRKVVGMLDGTIPVIADNVAAEALETARAAYPVGTAVRSEIDNACGVIDRAPFIEAETNRVIIPMHFIELRKIYASRYAEDVRKS